MADLDAASFAPSDIRVLFAVTRDPVERAISLYALMRRSPDWLPHIAPFVGDRNFEYFYEFCRDRGYYFPNDQCRRIGGSASFSATRSIIMERYSFVGSSDRIDLVASALRSRLSDILPGFSAPSVRLNGGKYGNDEIRLSKRMAAKVEDHNSEDAELHHFIVEEGGLYSRS
ncbi:MAG: hypothetical protein M9944_07080 [Rhizobiaceae bacterium]|nr:hypothetical protein [Rhizobiaceae bacterium]